MVSPGALPSVMARPSSAKRLVGVYADRARSQPGNSSTGNQRPPTIPSPTLQATLTTPVVWAESR